MVVGSLGIGARFLTMAEAAQLLSVHENTLRRWCDRGIIKCLRISIRGERRVAESDVTALITQMHENHGCVCSSSARHESFPYFTGTERDKDAGWLRC